VSDDDIERELKLVPADAGLLDRLAGLERLGPFSVRRRFERQRNSFFDTRSRALEAARLGFRRRIVEGGGMATWTLKSEGQTLRGVATRPEIELRLDAEMPPVMVLGTLQQAARQRGAPALAEEVADALARGGGGLVPARPVLETQTERTILDLEDAEHGWAAEMALEAARQAIEALGEVHESHGSKLSRALAHARACAC
jgi:inorganic triphosphatase YgiF